MSLATGHDWRELFAAESSAPAAQVLRLHVAQRHGADWLLLPDAPALAARGLALYPAQTTRARWARRALALARRLGLKPGLRAVELRIGPADPFVTFLRATAAPASNAPLRFALLAGNPHAPGHRFVILLFDAAGRPAAVVKAGATEAARHLIAREEEVLRAVPAALPGVPRLRETFTSGRVRALALDYFPGDSPSADDTARLSQLLGAWLSPDRWVTLGELPAWQRLFAAERAPELPALLRHLRARRVHPTLAHGDLAPWNIKSAGGQWTVLDWERGEIAGVPGWDWFHFVLQPALLVRRERPATLLRRCEAVWDSPAFKSYADRAGVGDHAPALALAYLFTCLHVTGQTEGREALQLLWELAAPRWARAN
jgi:hypothetical protein